MLTIARSIIALMILILPEEGLHTRFEDWLFMRDAKKRMKAQAQKEAGQDTLVH